VISLRHEGMPKQHERRRSSLFTAEAQSTRGFFHHEGTFFSTEARKTSEEGNVAPLEPRCFTHKCFLVFARADIRG